MDAPYQARGDTTAVLTGSGGVSICTMMPRNVVQRKRRLWHPLPVLGGAGVNRLTFAGGDDDGAPRQPLAHRYLALPSALSPLPLVARSPLPPSAVPSVVRRQAAATAKRRQVSRTSKGKAASSEPHLQSGGGRPHPGLAALVAVLVSALSRAWEKANGRYIRAQREHHRRRGFEQEFVAILKKHGIAYDPRYVFDTAIVG